MSVLRVPLYLLLISLLLPHPTILLLCYILLIYACPMAFICSCLYQYGFHPSIIVVLAIILAPALSLSIPSFFLYLCYPTARKKLFASLAISFLELLMFSFTCNLCILHLSVPFPTAPSLNNCRLFNVWPYTR